MDPETSPVEVLRSDFVYQIIVYLSLGNGGTMASILIFGSVLATSPWVQALREVGHCVETCVDVLAFQDRFDGAPADILVVEIINADQGAAMLMVQSRTVWRDCRVIALPRDHSYRSSAIFKMGLWAPDRLLMQPVEPESLTRSVQQLCIQARAERRIRQLREDSSEPIVPNLPPSEAREVILRCGEPPVARWAFKLS